MTEIHRVAAGLEPLLRSFADISLDPENVRTHDEKSISALVQSLNAFGQQKPIVILSDGRIVAGEGTFRAAKLMGWNAIAAVVFEGTEAEARAFALADNRTGELSSWDVNRLTEQLLAVAADSPSLSRATGFSEAELGRVGARAVDPEATAGPGSGEGRTPQGGSPAASSDGLQIVTLEFSSQDNMDRWYTCMTVLEREFPEESTIAGCVARCIERSQ